MHLAAISSWWLEKRQGPPPGWNPGCFFPFSCPPPGTGNGGGPGGGVPGPGGGGWPGWPGAPGGGGGGGGVPGGGGGGGVTTTRTPKTEPTPTPTPTKEEPKTTKTTPKAQPAPTDTRNQYTRPTQNPEPATTNRGSPGGGAGSGTTTQKGNTPTNVVNAPNSDTFVGSQGGFTTIPTPPPGESGFPAPTGGDGDSHNSYDNVNSQWIIVSPSTTYTASRPQGSAGVGGPGGTGGASNNGKSDTAGDSGSGDGSGGGLAPGAIAGIVIGLIFLLLLLALVLLRKSPFVQRMLAPLGLAQSPYGPTPGNGDGMGNSLLAGGAEVGAGAGAGAGAAAIAGAAGGAAVVGAAAAAASNRRPQPPPQPMQQVGNQRGLTIPVAAAVASSNRWRPHPQPEPYEPSPVSPISESSILIPRVNPTQPSRDPNPFPRRVSNRSLGAVSALSEVSAVSAGSMLSPSSIPWPMPPGTPPLTPDGDSPITSPGGVQQAQLINFQQMGNTVVRISNPRSSRSGVY